MSNEELNSLLYHKLFAEQEKLKKWLLEQPPSVILEHAYRYCMREDMLLCFENNDLPDQQARALLRSGEPLEKLYSKWESSGFGHMEEMWEIAQECAKEIAQNLAKTQSRGR